APPARCPPSGSRRTASGACAATRAGPARHRRPGCAQRWREGPPSSSRHRREGHQKGQLGAALSNPELPPERLHEPLATGRPHVDEALLDHMDGIEQPLEPLDTDAGGARAYDDTDVIPSLAVFLPADG